MKPIVKVGGAGVAMASALSLAIGVQAALAVTPAPTVSSVSVTGYPLPASPTVTVSGSNFGPAPTRGVSPARLSNCGSGTGLDYPGSQLWLLDASRGGGLSGAFEEGELFNSTTGNCGGIIIQSWSSTQATFTLGSRYATDGHSLESGDTVCVDVKQVPACTVLP